ncbi:MAG: PilZ domain-containing protein [Planctomycetota bacterium]
MQHRERRRSTRVRVVAVATLETQGALSSNDQAVCTVQDLSRTGIGLETGQPPIKGQAVVLRISLDDETHELRTRAARVQVQPDSHFYRIGLDWSACSRSELAFLDRVLGVLQEG